MQVYHTRSIWLGTNVKALVRTLKCNNCDRTYRTLEVPQWVFDPINYGPSRPVLQTRLHRLVTLAGLDQGKAD